MQRVIPVHYSYMLYAISLLIHSRIVLVLLATARYCEIYCCEDLDKALRYSDSSWEGLFTSNGWGSFKQFVSNLEVFTVVIELRASPGCTSPYLRNTLVCYPAKTQLIPAVPNSTDFFPAPEKPQHHVYAIVQIQFCLPSSKTRQWLLLPWQCRELGNDVQSSVSLVAQISTVAIFFSTSVTQKKLLAHFSPYVKLTFWGLMKPFNELAGSSCVWHYWCHHEIIVPCCSKYLQLPEAVTYLPST